MSGGRGPYCEPCRSVGAATFGCSARTALTFDAVDAMSTQQKDGAACAKSVRFGTWTTIT